MFKKFNIPFIIFEVAFFGIFTALIFLVGSGEGHGNISFIIAYIMMGFFALSNIFINVFLAKKYTGENSVADFGLFYPVEAVALFLSFSMAVRFHVLRPRNYKFAMFLFIALTIVYISYFIVIFYVVLQQNKNREIVRKKIFYIRSLASDIDSCINYCDDFVLKTALIQLSEDVKFSDPMSDEQLQSLDDTLQEEIHNLLFLVKDKKVNDANEKVSEISRLLKERNRKCKMLK